MPFIVTKINVPEGNNCVGCIHIKPCGSAFYCGAFAYEDAVSLYPLESSMKKHRHCLRALDEAKTQCASPTNTSSMSAVQIFADREVAVFMGQMADAFAGFCNKVNGARQKLHTA